MLAGVPPQNLVMNPEGQNRTIAIASDFRVDGAKSPEIPQKGGVLGSEIAARNRKSLATFHRTLKSQCSIACSCLGNRAISGVRDGHRNRKSQKSLRFRCAKVMNPEGQRHTNYSEPRSSTPCEMRFSHARKGKWPFSHGFFFEKAGFPFPRGKNRISQGVQDRGSL